MLTLTFLMYFIQDKSGFITPAFLIFLTNIPGILSKYVLLWPLKNIVSAAPAQLINLHYLSNDLAIDFAIDVVPVDAGSE